VFHVKQKGPAPAAGLRRTSPGRPSPEPGRPPPALGRPVRRW